MVIGERLQKLRESKKLSQGDVEKRTGLLRCYTSRVENGHTVPNIETLEKYARALEIPLYRLFHEGDAPPERLKMPQTETAVYGTTPKQSADFRALAKLLSRMKDRDRNLLLRVGEHLATRTMREKKRSAHKRG